jgi:hypothetical protein
VKIVSEKNERRHQKGKGNVDKISLDKMTFDKITFDEVSFEKT